VKRAKKRGKDMNKLRVLLELLIDGQPLPKRYRDHPLKGKWAGWRDAHIDPDWLLLYWIEGEELQLARTGTHADLFEE
jgi:mRNA interferase YafQ